MKTSKMILALTALIALSSASAFAEPKPGESTGDPCPKQATATAAQPKDDATATATQPKGVGAGAANGGTTNNP
jgi:hypothetical protein